MKLSLGTAQFGFSYGISNKLGCISKRDIAAILGRAKSVGIDTIDTAIAYGQSELNLGDAGVTDWRVVSKLPAIPEATLNISQWVNKEIQGSLARLRISSLYGLLLHYPRQLLQPAGSKLWTSLQSLKEQGLVEKIGYSIYDPSELDELWSSYRPDMVQAPFSILDRRIEVSGWLNRLFDESVELHVRSVFLQGLLLMKRSTRPAQFDRWSDLWEKWDRCLQERGLTGLQASLAFALSEPRITRVIIGVDSLAQFEQNLLASQTPVCEFPQTLASDDTDLLDPSNWKTL